jgi:hypothetical protein
MVLPPTVSLVSADSGTAPTGTGSHSYFANFTVLVANVAFEKQVQILAHDSVSGWNFRPCSFASAAPAGFEIWSAHLGSPAIDQFVVEYSVLGQTFWDNNGAANYTLDVAASEARDGTGSVALNPNVSVLNWFVDLSGNLRVSLFVKNLAFVKQLGLVYTTDDWATFHNAFGSYEQSYPPFGRPEQPNAESWSISAPVGIGSHGQFAVFYAVNGNTFWDNNLGANYPF